MPLEVNDLQSTVGRVLSNIYRDAGTFGVASSPTVDYRSGLMGQAISVIKDISSSPAVSVLKTIGIIATIILSVLFVWILLKMNRYFSERAARWRAELHPPSRAEGAYDARWKEVKDHLGSFRDAEWKFAVIEADKMVESILEQAGFLGETLGEKLKGIDKSQLQSLDGLWSAHKLRNLIAHDPDYQVQHRDAREAIGNYEKTLRELGVLS